MTVSRLPYTLVKNVNLEEYEHRVDKFNVHGCWNWTANKVIIYELSSKPHEAFIFEITQEITDKCRPVRGADAHVAGMGAVRKY